MLRYTSIGSKFILGILVVIAAIATYLPFLEAFALTPAIALIHRFSITLNLGNDTKTIQPIVFILPILLIKGLWDFHKLYGIKKLLFSPIAAIVGLLTIVDIISVLTSTSRGSSIGQWIAHAMNLGIFLTSSIWLKIVTDMIKRDNMKKYALRLVKTFSIALFAFTIVNSVVSISQFVDCSRTTNRCQIWNNIDAALPNKLLAVGHQKFSYTPVIIRAPGFFGDVNFNGMFSLFVALGCAGLLILSELFKTKNGYEPKYEQRYLLVGLVASIISFVLTLSRSAILGAVATGIVLGILYFVPIIKKVGIPKSLTAQIGKFGGISVFAMIVLFIIGSLIPLTYKSKQTTISAEIITYVKDMFSPNEDSAQGHADLFQSAIKIGNQNKLFGMGLGTFGVQYQKLIEPNGGTTANPHSTYGMLYAEQGLIGVIGYITVIVYLWFIAIKSSRKYVKELLQMHAENKKATKEFYLFNGAKLILILITFGIPFYSIATVSYYGFFLPMTWWWGNGELIN